MFNHLSDIQVIAIEKLAGAEAKRRKARSNIQPGNHDGEATVTVKFSMSVAEDTTASARDSLVMTRLALVLCERLERRLKSQGKALHVDELLEKAQGISAKVHPIFGKLDASRKSYLSTLPREPRKGAVTVSKLSGGAV
jgi:hypothetical protein